MVEAVFSTVSRPKIITSVCLLGFVGYGLGLIGLVGFLIFTGAFSTPTAVYQLLSSYGSFVIILTSLLTLVGLIGYWKMRKWGVYIYAVMLAIYVVYMLVVGGFNIFGFVLPVFIFIIGV